ncbi:esterase/lipase family protein [Sagittula stellata]|nr:hypothetical protein [Sagittula stellata]
MPMLRITVTDGEPRLHGATTPLSPTLRRALAEDPGPVTVMVHGYKYLPGHPKHCPHRTIFARVPSVTDPRVVSWPRHLGLRGQHGEGLGISFGWMARGTIWDAHAEALVAGHALARLVAEIRRIAPARPVNLVAHSLGARVALTAIGYGNPGAVSRAVLLAAAEYAGVACSALSGASGQATQVLNVTSRENDLYDFLLERLVPPTIPQDRMLGHGTPRLPNLVTLQLDDPTSLKTLRAAGFPIAEPQRLVCHWSPYLRAGVFPLYAAFLSNDLPLGRLRALLPETGTPRWSRILPRRPMRAPLALPAE